MLKTLWCSSHQALILHVSRVLAFFGRVGISKPPHVQQFESRWLTTSICCHGLHPPSATWPDLVMRVNAYTITMLSYVMVCHVLLYYVISYHIISYPVMSHFIASRYVSLHGIALQILLHSMTWAHILTSCRNTYCIYPRMSYRN